MKLLLNRQMSKGEGVGSIQLQKTSFFSENQSILSKIYEYHKLNPVERPILRHSCFSLPFSSGLIQIDSPMDL